MRPLRPLFERSTAKDELERQAERLRNRDWIELLRVVHPAQAAQAEQEYLLARLRGDWPELVNPLLAQHTQPAEYNAGILLVHCDHNTFANELTLLASVVEKKIATRYGYPVRLRTKTTRRLAWHSENVENPKVAEDSAAPRVRPANTILATLIEKLSEFETRKNKLQ